MVLQPVRGTRDLLDQELANHKHIIKTAESIAATYGYKPIETPIFEYTSVFQRTLGDTSDIVGKEMYTFSDRGGDSVTLRPEGTAPVVRAMMTQGLTQILPQKRIYSGPMFRYERPQKGRYRQFHQLGVEYLGASNPFADVECIALADHILKFLGIHSCTLYVNTLGDLESRSVYRQALVDYFAPYRDDLSEDSKIRLDRNPLRILDSKNPDDQKICQGAPQFDDYMNATSRDFFVTVCDGLAAVGIEFTRDPHLVRGLDYYCHTAFEFKTTALGAQDAILAGGRYDGLMEQMGGPAMPGIGWALGIDRLALLLPQQEDKPPFKVAVIPVGDDDYTHSLVLAQNLRHNSVTVEIIFSGANIGKRLKQADKNGCTVAILLGADEVASNTVKVRDLRGATAPEMKERTVDRRDLTQFLKAEQLS
ncbi:MAG: histidine--tRNA ligase [Alphaproteobacteria bacterium]|nr:histidine--tRNA ligase [Alphaproteobacteria bacterium]